MGPEKTVSKKSKKHKRKRERSESTGSNDIDNIRKKSKKHKRKREKMESSSSSDIGNKRKKSKKEKQDEELNSFDVPIPESVAESSKSMAPMTKEEWDKRQSVIRKVYDEATGRHRLIKGDGEILEEIVTHTRHKEINKQATRGDGENFQNCTMKKCN